MRVDVARTEGTDRMTTRTQACVRRLVACVSLVSTAWAATVVAATVVAATVVAATAWGATVRAATLRAATLRAATVWGATVRAAAGLAATVLAATGCVIVGTVGDDPRSTVGSGDEGFEVTTTGPLGTFGQTSASVSQTGGITGISTGGLDERAALELCGVPPVVEPAPGDPVLFEFIECAGGCEIELEMAEPIGLLEFGECLCAALACGPLSGGGGSGGLPGATTVATTGPDQPAPQACGPFPEGEETLVCECESCSVDVDGLDGLWLGREADLMEICACACNDAGCGMPLPMG